ncbi:hypothetical protein V6N12_069236 [Hibiscus sabdariffa]|uniref:SHSP domain-containing protein n=1 Tax=Hibiscus sabdariffa TaxID=183260 RepID=A0ABR2FD84_9ROSI
MRMESFGWLAIAYMHLPLPMLNILDFSCRRGDSVAGQGQRIAVAHEAEAEAEAEIDVTFMGNCSLPPLNKIFFLLLEFRGTLRKRNPCQYLCTAIYLPDHYISDFHNIYYLNLKGSLLTLKLAPPRVDSLTVTWPWEYQFTKKIKI